MNVFVQFKDSRWLSADRDETNRISSVDLNSYMEHMSKETSFGDGIMLEMALAKYRRPICVVSKDFPKESILLSNDQVANARCMFLAYNGSDHYDSILPCPSIYSTDKTPPLQSNDPEAESPTYDLDSSNSNAHTSQRTSDEGIIHLHRDGRHYVFCATCCKNPEIVRVHCHKSRLPPIATETGTVYRQAIVSEHLASLWHTEAVKCDGLRKLNTVEISVQAPLDKLISKGNEGLANKVGNLMMSVYNDAKRLTLSEYSWPSRVVASQRGCKFVYNEMCSTVADKLDLQYVNPASHRKFLDCIVNAHSKDVLNSLLNSIALSVRLDGSVDRTQIDKIYVLTKSINEKGETQQTFIGVAEPDQRGAAGVMSALKQALTANFGEDGLKLLSHMSSVVTDGASVNVGAKGGVWALLESEVKLLGKSETDQKCSQNVTMPPVPLLKIWCAVHRSQLAWRSVSDTVTEVKYCFQNLVSLVSYFHTSGVRSRELNKMAEDNALKILRLPVVFEVRWTEFSYTLLNAVLTSWSALTTYLMQSSEVAARGHSKFLTSHSHLQLLSFLADLLFVFARFQKRLQSDSTTLLDMQHAVNNVQSQIAELKEKPLIGGWQETLERSVTVSNGDICLKGTYLSQDRRRREQHHLLVSDKRDFAAVRNEIVQSLSEFLSQRFSLDEALISCLVPFVQFDEKNVNMREIHSAVGSDLDLAELSCEFTELANHTKVTSMKLPELVKHLASNGNADLYRNVLIVMSRILAAKPHSADVERCISANNLLKTSLRASLKLDTENSYLFIHHNLPAAAEWDPRSSVLHWLQTPRHEMTSKKGKFQEYFRHVFSEAHEKQTYEDLDHCDSAGTFSSYVRDF